MFLPKPNKGVSETLVRSGISPILFGIISFLSFSAPVTIKSMSDFGYSIYFYSSYLLSYYSYYSAFFSSGLSSFVRDCFRLGSIFFGLQDRDLTFSFMMLIIDYDFFMPF